MEIMNMRPIEPLWKNDSAQDLSGTTTGGPVIPFADVFQAAVDQVRETDATKNEMQYLLATGQLDNPAEAVIAASEASLSVELLVQLRNKALDAYNELMRISM